MKGQHVAIGRLVTEDAGSLSKLGGRWQFGVHRAGGSCSGGRFCDHRARHFPFVLTRRPGNLWVALWLDNSSGQPRTRSGSHPLSTPS